MATWACPNCSQASTFEFDACWNCGCTSDGECDPTFRVADAIDPRSIPTIDPDKSYLPYPPWKKQISLRLLLGIIAFIALLSALFLRTPHGRGLLADLIQNGIAMFLFAFIVIALIYFAGCFVLAIIEAISFARSPTSSVDESISESATQPPTLRGGSVPAAPESPSTFG